MNDNLERVKVLKMKNPTYSEAIHMIKSKRQKAKAAFSQIIEAYGVFSNESAPGLDVLLDYFNNMVYGLELLLKVLAKDWEQPNVSRFEHGVGNMYKTIFNHDYKNPQLMAQLKQAIMDQKYLYEPGDKLLDRVPELEELWDELAREYDRRTNGKIESVMKNVKMDGEFGKYLCDNVERFYQEQSQPLAPFSKEKRIQRHEAHIARLQREIERLRNSQETLDQEHRRQLEQGAQAFVEKILSLKETMKLRFEMVGGSELEFGTFGSWMTSGSLG